MKNEPIYSVIVPAFKEEVVLEDSLRKLLKSLKEDTKRFNNTEVIVVAADGGDSTALIAKKFAKQFAFFKLVEPGLKVGKGRDVRAGMLVAKGKYRLFTDADMATPTRHIQHAFHILEEGADVVIGIRPLKRIHNSFSRRARSVLSNLIIRFLAVPGVNDTQCGFKGFSAEATERLFEPLQTYGWGFDIEILVRARARRYNIAQMTITDWYDPKIGALGLSGESDWQANMSTLKELLRISKKRFTGYYKH
jgi:glycosyltransferase involved in cell wall biosynthesis